MRSSRQILTHTRACFDMENKKNQSYVVSLVHTAEAVYCQLGDIGIGLERPSKLDESINPSGKLVGEFAALQVSIMDK